MTIDPLLRNAAADTKRTIVGMTPPRTRREPRPALAGAAIAMIALVAAAAAGEPPGRQSGAIPGMQHSAPYLG